MPWEEGDVPSHTKKARGPKAKRQWVHVANNMLAHGASEAAAVRGANSAVKKRGQKRGRKRGSK